jgi:hypothetical protein
MWSEHIYPNHLQDIHLPEDDQQCWELGCGDTWALVFCSLRCRLRIKLYHFLPMFHNIISMVDDIDM